MEPRFLFPHRYKLVGWAIALPSIILGLFVLFDELSFGFLDARLPFQFGFSEEFLSRDSDIGIYGYNFTNELAIIGSIIGLVLIAFSKVKLEDEYVSKIRLESLQWAIYFNYAMLILATILVYGMAYYQVAIFNMITPLVFFIVRFHYIIFIKK